MFIHVILCPNVENVNKYFLKIKQLKHITYRYLHPQQGYAKVNLFLIHFNFP